MVSLKRREPDEWIAKFSCQRKLRYPWTLEAPDYGFLAIQLRSHKAVRLCECTKRATSFKPFTRLGLNVRRRREIKDLSQESLAAAAELDQTYISNLEAGRRNPTLATQLKLARALDCTVSELLSGVED